MHKRQACEIWRAHRIVAVADHSNTSVCPKYAARSPDSHAHRARYVPKVDRVPQCFAEPIGQLAFCMMRAQVLPRFAIEIAQYRAAWPIRQADHDDPLPGARLRHNKTAAGMRDNNVGLPRIVYYKMPRLTQRSDQLASHKRAFVEPVDDGDAARLRHDGSYFLVFEDAGRDKCRTQPCRLVRSTCLR